ncbi:MAG: hypothetical protein ACYCVL_01445 [Gemmatimonadaceae bacterium]
MPRSNDVEFAKLLQDNRNAIDDYINSVRALHALGSHLTFDDIQRRQGDGTKFGIPRTMTRQLETGEDHDVTPDAVIQVSTAYGVVAEMKKNFPSIRPDEVFEQIAKYDTPLRGWWTADETIARHDLVLMTHTFSSVRAADAYKDWVERGNSFVRMFAVVEFGYQEQGKLWFYLRRTEGRLSDEVRDERLRTGVPISGELVTRLFDSWKFSEQAPPLTYMLLLTHTYILPLFPTQEEYENRSGARRLTVEVTAAQVRDKMVEQWSPPREARQTQLPKLEWVRQALAALERVGLATALDREQDRYRVSLARLPRRDAVEYFTRRLFRRDQEEKQKRLPVQPELFPESAS